MPNNIKLIIAGAVQDHKYLLNLWKLRDNLNLKDRVYMVGHVDEETKEILYQISNVVVIPSLSDIVEAYSIVLTEALFYNKPVVVFPSGALKYRIINGVNGYIAREKTPKALATAILDAFKLGKTECKTYSKMRTLDILPRIYKLICRHVRRSVHIRY